MVSQQDVIDSIVRTLDTDPSIPDSITYISYEPDFTSDAIKLPIIQVLRNSVTRVDETNTDFVGYKRDNSSSITDRVYERLYVMDLTISVWTADGSVYEDIGIEETVRNSLYKHDFDGPKKPLLDSSGNPIDDVWNVKMTNTRENDNVTFTPTLRITEQDMRVWAGETFDDPVTDDTSSGSSENITLN